MNTEDRFDDLLTQALRADAPREAPSRLLDATMNRIADLPQRGSRRLGGSVGRLLAAAVIVLLAVLAGTQLAGLIARPAGTGPSVAPSIAPSASLEPSASVAPSATATPSSPETAPAWTATGSMSGGRILHTATLLADGKVLVAGSAGSATPGSMMVYSFTLATAELYDPGSGSWTATGSMSGGRILHTATLLPDGKVLVAGGADSISETSVNALATAELYDPATGNWTATGNMIEARARHTATLLANGKVLVAGGSGSAAGSDSLATAELYDPATGTWTATGTMIEARTYQTATLLPDGKVLVAGGDGRHGPQLASAELYDPGTGSWTATGTMVKDHAEHTATLLQDGRVLVLGGSSAPPTPSPTATAELYDPRTGSWTAAESMNREHYGGTATLLDDGSVLLAGGGSSGGSGGEELYDPSTGSWSATASMLEVRTNHSATLLDDGSVLMAGGINPRGMLATAELYDPGSGS
jgi:Kelch motif/Galactose oxidase, central domain